VHCSSTGVAYWTRPSFVEWLTYVDAKDIQLRYQTPMRFVFYNYIGEGDKNLPLYSYAAYVNQFGFSGVDASILELSRALAALGHDVTICLAPYNGPTCTDAVGIRYCSIDAVKDWTTVDVFCPAHFPFDYNPFQIYQRLDRSRAKIVTWFHHRLSTKIFQGHEMLVKAGFDVRFVYPSKYAALPFFENSYTPHQAIIGGGIDPEIFPKELPNSDLKRGKWVFHAGIGRGFTRSIDVFEKVPGAEAFTLCYWYQQDEGEDVEALRRDHPRVSVAGRLGKRSLVQRLCDSDYFAYFLSSPGHPPYHDTYSQCVLEAMACGVIVVTWDVACMREVYGDRILLVPPPDGYDGSGDPVDHPFFHSNEAVEMFAKAITALEADPESKEAMRRRAFEWAREQTWDRRAQAFLNICEQRLDLPA
jgi:hypothetical protein